MSCPACDHTLQGIGQTTDGRRHFWCPRCGTLRSEAGKHADTESPKIVSRAQDLLREIWMEAHLQVGGVTGEGHQDRVVGMLRDLAEASNGRKPPGAATGRPDR